MAYRNDPDLEFLQSCSNDDLEILVNYLVQDQDGKERYGQKLTDSRLYKKYYPEHQKYWRSIAAELQLYGANTLVSLFRGNQGVLYKEILGDICKRMKVEFIEEDEIENLEKDLIIKMLSNSIDGMSPEELEQLVEQLNLDAANMSQQSIKEALVLALKAGGSSLLLMSAGLITYGIAARFGLATVATVAGFGAITGGTALGVLLGPIGAIALTGISVAGPAFRVTIPCVVQVAYMRLKNRMKIITENS